MTGVDRGLFHRRDQRGGAKPLVAGAGHLAGWKRRCSFCQKPFATEISVWQHEASVHRKKIAALTEQSAAEPFNSIPWKAGRLRRR